MLGDDSNKETWFPPLLHLSFILQQLADELLLREAGISVSQARILSVLDTSKPCLQNRVALSLRQTEANVSRQLKAMKKNGLVSIEKNKKDGRARDVKMAAKGRAAYEKAAVILEDQMTNLINSTGVKIAGLA